MKRLVALAVLALALCGVATAASPPARLPEGARLGMLRVPRLGINVRVLQGAMNLYTQDWPSTLNGGPSHYPDTSLPWQYGTVGIAGHRVTHMHLDRMRWRPHLPQDEVRHLRVPRLPRARGSTRRPLDSERPKDPQARSYGM